MTQRNEPEDPDSASIQADPARGFVDQGWFTEEHRESCRVGIRIADILHEEVTPHQRIVVYESPFFGKVLTLDDLVMLTERDEFVYHEMLVHVPLLAHPQPRSALVVGGGDCACLRELLKHSELERIVLCELDEAVTQVCERFLPWVAAATKDPRVVLRFEDAVRYVSDTAERFDVIVVDSTDPVGPAARLFERRFYRAARRVLRPGGVLAAQSESPHWSAELVSRIFSELRTVFPHVAPYLGGVPSYPSGFWSWAYASENPPPEGPVGVERSRAIAAQCRYYNPEAHRGAFLLPTFVRELLAGDNPFARFDEGNPDDTGCGEGS